MPILDAFRHHVFVCTRRKEEGECCATQGSQDLFEQLKAAIQKAKLPEVKLTTCGCLGLCDRPGNVLVYPEGTWYSGGTPREVEEIVEQHLRRGEPVQRLAWPTPEALRAHMAAVRERHQREREERQAGRAG
jgi:(2Fe-2S) ferredoxin